MNSFATSGVRLFTAVNSVVLRFSAMLMLSAIQGRLLLKYSAPFRYDQPCSSVRSFTLSASSKTVSLLPWVVLSLAARVRASFSERKIGE